MPTRALAILPVFAVAILLLAVPAARAQDVGALVDRIDRLERDIRDLHVQMARGGPAGGGDGGGSSAAGSGGSPAVARLSVRITDLEDSLRQVTGRLEELSHRITQVGRQMEKLAGDVEYRFSRLEQGGQPGQSGQPGQAAGSSGRARSGGGTAPPPSAASSGGPVQSEGPGETPVAGYSQDGGPRILGTIPQSELPSPGGNGTMARLGPQGGEQQGASAEGEGGKPASDRQPQGGQTASTPPQPQLSPREEYMRAFGQLRRAEYDAAEQALKRFLQAHPDHTLASNARYWLGETYYVRADYVQAAETFLKGYQDQPTGNKAPDTLLKLGMSLANLDKQAQACATFDKLGKEFPEASPTIRRKLESERKKNGCE